MTLLDPVFWRQIGWALVRTGLAGLVPFLPGLTSDPAGTWPAAVGTVGLLLVVTVATSVSGIATPDTAPWWQVLMSRGLRQFGQFFAAGLVGAVVLSDVNWPALLQGAGASAASTIILAALTIIPGETLTEPARTEIGLFAGTPLPDEDEQVDYEAADGAEPGPDDDFDDAIARDERNL